MKTTTVTPEAPAWLVIDAEGQSLGRMAAEIAHVLRGKHKPSFSPHQLCGDHVIVINASKLAFTQKKLLQKMYYSHSGYLGHLKATPLDEMMQKHPERVVEKAVKRMLPKNRLRADILKRLHIFAGAEHTHAAQKPTPLSLNA